jgi:hypothetical protein
VQALDNQRVSDKLTPEEDATLRRLHWFEKFGVELAPGVRVVKATIRSRDKRSVIRDPTDGATRDLPGTKNVT